MKKIVTVVIADDHPIFRRGLCEVIEEDASVKLAGEADHGQAALQLIQQFKPTVAVLDHDMPRLNGLQVARAVRQQKLGTALVMLTMFKEERLFNEAMDAGFLGYVLKENAAQDLLNCIHAVAAGNPFITPIAVDLSAAAPRARQRSGHRESRAGKAHAGASGESLSSSQKTSPARRSPSNLASVSTRLRIIGPTFRPSSG